MQRLADALVLSPSDLTAHLACEHLTELNRAVVRGELARPFREDPHAQLIAEHGDRHEQAYLAFLEAQGEGVVRIGQPRDRSLEALQERARDTEEAMRAGARIVFQAALFDGRRRGHADFLERVDGIPTELGDWGYEVVDTKLARSAKPSHVLQLCAYSTHVARIQGRDPERAHLVLGDGTRESFVLRELAAVHRRAEARLGEVLAGAPRVTYPEPVPHCQVCDWARRCHAQRRADDHLSFVANSSRLQREKLVSAAITTTQALADAPPAPPPPKFTPESYGTLHVQAELQVRTRDSGELQRRDLGPEPGRGYARLPGPDDADVFFDLEGDPYVHGGLEYLWGYSLRGADGAWAYTADWAHDPGEERRRFEAFVDLVRDRHERHPGLHVFHYAHHEESTLKRLAQHHATREDAVDQLLRAGVLVDLFAVLRQAMQVGQESYSIKAIEPFYGFDRASGVREGGGSIVAYERWLETGEDEILEELAHYNREDVESTRELRDWLLACRTAAEARGVEFAPAPPEQPRDRPAWWDEHVKRHEALLAGLPEDPEHDDADGRERRLLAALLGYHARERKPQWWRYFALTKLSSFELIEERDAIGELAADPSRAPVQLTAKSQGLWLRFPQQEHRLERGEVVDPATGEGAGEIVDFDADGRGVLLKRTPKVAQAPLPRALIAGVGREPRAQREALWALADEVLAGGRSLAAARSVVRREAPEVGALLPLAGTPTEADLVALVRALEGAHLPVQGPPGSGKTYLGARLIVALLEAGWRIGVAAQSHKAIHNLLREVEAVAVERRVELRGFHKCSGPGSSLESEHGLIESKDDNGKAEGGGFNLVSGTSYLFARQGMRDRPLDLLVVDEAGQVALADAVAMSTAARRVAFLGDPQQLPQVTQAAHPAGSGGSVLEHLLAGAPVVAPDRGAFLDRTRRMHPDITAFVSEAFYAGELGSAPGLERRRVDAPGGALRGAGLRFLPVRHRGNAQAAPEEAEAVAAACRDLLAGGTVHGTDERPARALLPEDILVVAPYNLAVRCLAAAVPPGVRVGTVDRFQGQQAPVVFWAMTSSTGEDVPRGLEFLFSLNRLNVAISRAQCLAVLVASPRLLDAQAARVEQLPLLNAACRLVERAEVVPDGV